MAVIVNGNEIVLSGTVGYLYWEDGFDHADVVLALAQVGRDQDVVIRLNSGGGVATEGAAIHAALQAHRGRKTIVVEGIAGSAASVIACAGDEVVMALGSILMIHDPSGFTFGTVDDHQKTIVALNALANAVAGIYADKSGKTIDECRAEMRAEAWLEPEAAVAAGYADRVGAVAANENGEPEIVEADPADEPVAPTAFNYRLFKNAPDRLVALADKNGWASRSPVLAATSAANRQRKEPSMATQNQADRNAVDKTSGASAEMTAGAVAGERARIAAIMSSEEARGRADLAQHLAFETEMSADAAKAALAKAPAEAAAAAKEPNRFEQAMTTAGNPKVGADVSASSADPDEIDTIFASAGYAPKRAA